MRTPRPLCSTLALVALTATAACGGPEELEQNDETEEALQSGYLLLQNAQALFVERCLTAPGQAAVPAVAALCDRNRADQGFLYDLSTNRHWIKSQTTGPGKCLTVSGTKVLLQPCVDAAANQAWTRTIVTTSPVLLAQYQFGSGCLTLQGDGTTAVVACSGAKNQLWSLGLPNTLGVSLATGALTTTLYPVVMQEVATVQASAQTIAETQGRIQRWKIHPIAYQPKGVAQQNVGVIVTGHDTNDVARTYASAQIVRNTAQPNDFHALWRVSIGATGFFPHELVFVGGAVAKALGVSLDSWSDGSALIAMIRRDFLAVAANNALVSSPSLTKLAQTTLVARAVPPFGTLLRGVLGSTPATVTPQLPSWSQLATTAMTFAPRNGYPGDLNAPPSTCTKNPRVLSGVGITAAACAANPLTFPVGRTCGFQDATFITTVTISCNWVCCPTAI